MDKYKFIDHTADIKFKAWGETLGSLFENSVLAIVNFMSRGEKISPKKSKVINVSGEDLESLFYNFLEEIISLIDTDKFITSKAEVTLRGNNLKAELYGDDSKSYGLDCIKSPTYSEMYIKKVKSTEK